MKERLLYINKDDNIIKKIINAPIEATRCFLLVLNELQIKNKLVADGENFYGSVEYCEEDCCMIIIPISNFKKYGIVKNNRTITEVKELLNIMYKEFAEYIDNDNTYFDDEENVVITLKDDIVLTPGKMFDKFIAIDLIQFTQLRSKIQIFIYLKIMQFTKSGIVRMKIEEVKETLQTPMLIKELIRKLKNAVAKLEEIMQIGITFNTVKKGRDITSIKLNFRSDQNEL